VAVGSGFGVARGVGVAVSPGKGVRVGPVKVGVATFPGEPESIEVRVDFPEGRGSFWETLKRGGQGTPRR